MSDLNSADDCCIVIDENIQSGPSKETTHEEPQHSKKYDLILCMITSLLVMFNLYIQYLYMVEAKGSEFPTIIALFAYTTCFAQCMCIILPQYLFPKNNSTFYCCIAIDENVDTGLSKETTNEEPQYSKIYDFFFYMITSFQLVFNFYISYRITVDSKGAEFSAIIPVSACSASIVQFMCILLSDHFFVK